MFELAMPWALMAWIVPVLIWFLVPRASKPLPAALKVPFFNAIRALVDSKQQRMEGARQLILPTLIWMLLIFALAGPRWVGEPRPVTQEGYNIVLALDISGSMEVTDRLLQGRPVSRLAVVKRSAEQFVKDRLGDKIGLVLFGSRAYLQTPLTTDRKSVLMRIDDATVGLAGKTTSIGDALGLAVKHLQSVQTPGRIIILLTDGANNSGVLEPLKAAELAQLDGIKVYTIGLGASLDTQTMNGLFMSMGGVAELDEGTLKAIAKMTGGQYFRATNTESLQAIYQSINQMEKVSHEEASVRPQWDYYPWPLAMALLLFIGWQLLTHRSHEESADHD